MVRAKSSNQGGKKGARYAKKMEESKSEVEYAPIMFRDSPEVADLSPCYATVIACHGANCSAMNKDSEKITISVKKKHRRSIHVGAVVLGSSFGSMYEILHIYTPEQIVVLKDSEEYIPYRLDDDCTTDDVHFTNDPRELGEVIDGDDETADGVDFDDI
jgi:hypothetical protein